MTTTDLVETIIANHDDVLSRARIAEARDYVRDGEAWLAAYRLVRAGLRDGWLTDDEAAMAGDLARRRMFSKLSDDTLAALANRSTSAVSAGM